MSDTDDTLREQSMDDLRDYLENLEVAFDEEGEPIFLLSSDVEGILKAVRKRDAYIIGSDVTQQERHSSDRFGDWCGGQVDTCICDEINALKAEQRKRAKAGDAAA